MKRKALLINPGYYETGDYGYSYSPNMGLLKIGRHLKNKGVDVEYLDFSIPIRLFLGGQNLKSFYTKAPFVKWAKCGNFKSEGIMKPIKYYGLPHDQMREAIKEARPTEVWLGTGLTYYWEAAKDIAQICKEVFPKVPVLLGGIYPTLWPDHARTHICSDLVHQGPLDDIDDLMPDYDLDPNPKSIRVIQTGKGCNVFPPCSFCAVVSMDPKFKPISPDPVFSYIQEEYKKGANFWQIWSSQLLVPPVKFIGLLDKIVGSGLKIGLVASEGVQASLMTKEIAEKMKRAGFISVSVPMESIDEKRTEEFRKPSTFNDYEKAVELCQEAGFEMVKSFVMAGVPGQSYDEIIHGIVDCWARDSVVALHQYTPIPGSEDWGRFPQFHNSSPEELHPSLWPGASDDLKVEALEEIKRIVRMGYFNFVPRISTKEEHRVGQIWDLFVKWSKHYGLLTRSKAPVLQRPLAPKGYQSCFTKSYLQDHVHS